MKEIIVDLYGTILTFVRERETCAAPVVFALAFGESLAFISHLLPATAILFGVGGLIGATGIGFWPIRLAAAAWRGTRRLALVLARAPLQA